MPQIKGWNFGHLYSVVTETFFFLEYKRQTMKVRNHSFCARNLSIRQVDPQNVLKSRNSISNFDKELSNAFTDLWGQKGTFLDPMKGFGRKKWSHVVFVLRRTSKYKSKIRCFYAVYNQVTGKQGVQYVFGNDLKQLKTEI